MQTLIRIEHPESGKGHFTAMVTAADGKWYRPRGNSIYDDSIYARHTCMRNMTDDVHGAECGVHFCAYRNLDEMKDWMEPEWTEDLIRNCGFRVYMIEVTECLMGSQQGAFELRHIISKKDISELFLK